MLRGPFAVAIWDPRDRVLTLARDPLGLKCGHVAPERALLRLRHHAERPVRSARRAARIERGENRRFPRAQSRRTRDDHLPGYLPRPPAHVAHRDGEARTTQHRYWSTDDIEAGKACFRSGLCGRTARMPRRGGATANAQRPSDRLPPQRRARFLVGRGALRTRAAEKNQRLAAFTRMPRQGFDAPVPPATMPTKRRMWRRSARRPETSTSHMSGTTNATISPSSIGSSSRWKAPVRNPTNLGWMLAISRLARTQGRRVLLGGLLGNYTISWNGWSQTVDHLLRGRVLTALRQAWLYRRITSFALGGDPQAARRANGSEGLATGLTGGAIPRGSRPGMSTGDPPDFAAAMGVDARASERRPRFSVPHAAAMNGSRGSGSITAATGMRPKRP